MEHLFSPHLSPRFAHGLLTPGGLLAVSTPYHRYWKIRALSLFGTVRQVASPALWHGGHIKLWRRKTLASLPATRSDAAKAKAAAHTLNDGSPAHSFATLLAELSTIVRNTCRAPPVALGQATFQVTTLPNAKPQRVLKLIQRLHL